MLKLFEYNNSSNLLAVLNNAREVKILREINGAYTLSFNCPADEKADFACTVGGRCCESGDLIQENVLLPKPKRGDILAVLVTGAYNYSMASNYNRVARPPVVVIRGGEDKLAVRRERFEDLIACDI